ncbi:dystroglycan-related [Anaeramoeba flamelloides]|uniref:Dystroglycan-related n=1 Tax=Anaeramoeba flamelloides TaxID=1746091 RepID=A0ABQ8XMP4_9EUKA|nr:dystroglycan-related [Anaeramoeba flamelloides]
MKFFYLCVFLICLSFALSKEGCGPHHLGDTIVANTEKSSDQIEPSMRRISDTLFLTVWQSENQDGDGMGIYSSLVEMSGDELDSISTVGGEFLVNDDTSSNQIDPDVTTVISTSAGGKHVMYVYVNEWNADDTCCSLYGRTFAIDGTNQPTPEGASFEIVAQNVKKPSVAALPGTDLAVVVYTRISNRVEKVFGVIYNISGTDGDYVPVVQVSEFEISEDSSKNAKIAAMANNFFAVTWQSYDTSSDIITSIYELDSASTVIVRNEKVTVNVETQGEQSLPSVVHVNYEGESPTMTYLGYVWQGSILSNETCNIFLGWAEYDYIEESLSFINTEDIVVNSAGSGEQRYPSIGYFLNNDVHYLNIIWQGQFKEDSDTDTQVRCKFYNVTAQSSSPVGMGDEVSVSKSPTFGDVSSAIINLDNDRYVVAWQEVNFDSSGYGVALQLMSSNQAPELTSDIPNQNASIAMAYAYVIESDVFTDPDSDTPGEGLDFVAKMSNNDDLPEWLSFEPSSREFTGTPDTCDMDYDIKVTATDGCGGSVETVFNLGITNTEPRLIHNFENQNATNGKYFEYIYRLGTFEDDENNDLTITYQDKDGETIDWLNIDQENRRFYGDVEHQCKGNEVITVTCTDSCDASVEGTFTITTDRKDPQVGEEIETQEAEGNKNWEFQIPESAFLAAYENDPLGLDAKIENAEDVPEELPEWLSFDSETNTLSGKPPNEKDKITFRIIATDECGISVKSNFRIEISPTKESPASLVTFSLFNLLLIFFLFF